MMSLQDHLYEFQSIPEYEDNTSILLTNTGFNSEPILAND